MIWNHQDGVVHGSDGQQTGMLPMAQMGNRQECPMAWASHSMGAGFGEGVSNSKNYKKEEMKAASSCKS